MKRTTYLTYEHGTFIAICEALGEYPPDVFEEISLKYMRYVDIIKQE